MKTKSLLALSLSAALLLNGAIVTPVHASKKKDACKAYYSLIKDLHKGDGWEDGYDKFKLIYVDDDKVPELLAVDTPADYLDNNGTYQYELYTFYNGQATKLGNYSSGVASAGGYRGNTMYRKKSGKIFETYISSGTGDGGDTVYKQKKGKMVRVAHGDYHLADNTQEWNDKSVSNKTYSKKLQKAFNTKKGTEFTTIKTISYSAMRKKLKKSM